VDETGEPSQSGLVYCSEEKVNAGELGEVACAALAAGAPAEGLLEKFLQRLLNDQNEAGFWGNVGDDVEDLALNATKILAFWYRYIKRVKGE
jgi:hypothetical protein